MNAQQTLIAALAVLLLACEKPATDGAADGAGAKAGCLPQGAPRRLSLSGGSFMMGSKKFYREEAPVREVFVDPFEIDAHEVTNRQFKAFVDATGYVTLAERPPDPALHPDIPADRLAPGSAVFVMGGDDRDAGIWEFREGANWREPLGPGSGLDGKMDRPVVHVAYEDALAYADWAGGDLPTEAEWEYAARGGLDGADYAWGDVEPDDMPAPPANTWQGIFPFINMGTDGYAGLAPVGCYAANGYGLYDMMGNVWEWVKDADPDRNQGLIKGGSYLCAENFCRRYRPAARYPQELDFSTNHIGFRVVYRSGA